MPQFTSPRPLTLAMRKPRNPLVVPAQFRQAGRHQSGSPRRDNQRALAQSLRELWSPPHKD
ncbi:hypothetical protein HNQ51_003683 [Inhella inkyongensis]|uniref:Uncharacterized protein n=1 Tax=Inhella inkyongensis TaxID=392593 RepID=A0A840S4U5_9BURK|nr:hypothetical protein [Inhella inkyongensis]